MNAPTKPPPPKRNGAPPPSSASPPAASAVSANGDRFQVRTGRRVLPQKVVIYGPGGIGKSTLASLAPNPIFLDIETSTERLDVARLDGIETWADLRAVIQSDRLDGYGTLVLDSATKAEELAVA